MNAITPTLLRRLAPSGNAGLILALAPLLDAQLAPAVIDSPLRQAHFLGQACYETGYLTRLSENLNYSASRIVAVFPRLADRADELANNPEALGNAAYANRFGNGDEASGDGFRFAGKGLLMTTFRANYEELGLAYDPDILLAPEGAVSSAIAFWTKRQINDAADADNIKRVTQIVTGGASGLDERDTIKRQAFALLCED